MSWLDRTLTTIVASFSRIIRLTKQNCHLLPELLRGWQNFLSVRNTSKNKKKFKLENHEH